MADFSRWQAQGMPPRRSALIDSIPFRRIETTGQQALAVWEGLKAEGEGWPVVVGGDEALELLMEQGRQDGRPPEAILAAAAGLRFPAALHVHQAAERRRFAVLEAPMQAIFGQARTLSADEFRAMWGLPADYPMVAPPMPEVSAAARRLSAAYDRHGHPLARVHILLLPTREGAAVPAFLGWGGWNANPPAEFHVAALRSWQARYGAELVGIHHDTMNLHVARRPATEAEALALAQEQFTYCEDIVRQGHGTVAPLAAALLADDWWRFWWD
ncbi:MAG TPA: DUF4253 domain-containing protein [Roseomonas sp.]